ncbi:MAG TPA: SPFH domain-containing protein [Planctomycetota bacterium]|nr:SPFH domain-containing protein [Planctomycetota bacterium]
MPDNPWLIALVAAAALVLFGFALLVIQRYKRCPSNKVLVIYGRVNPGQSARCLHGGGAFVWPLIQDYAYLNLDPVQIEVPLRGALSMENIRVNVPSVFTVAIGTEPHLMQNAAIRLLGLDTKAIVKQAEDIIFGQLRQVIASMAIQDINRDREKFLENIQRSLEPELEKIGLVLINVNITDITDESGYIEAIGRKAASQAVQQAEIDVAEQTKRGAIGVAEAEREKAVQVAQAQKLREIGMKEADRDKLVSIAELDKETAIGQQAAAFAQQARVKDEERKMRGAVAEADASAVVGENKAKAAVAEAEAALRIKQAEAYQAAETRHREAEAAVLQAQYAAQAVAAEVLARKIEMEKRAELEAAAKAQKAKVVVDAEADAEQRRIQARAEADAVYARLEAQARGEYEILAKKADGLQRIVEGCGGAQQAFQLLMVEKIETLAATAAQAIANLKFDKVVVWDGQQGGATANFVRSLAGALPPALQMLRDVGGIQFPDFLGKLAGAGDGSAAAGSAPTGSGAPAAAAPEPGPT